MTDKDYDGAAEWAEHDMSLPENSKSSLRGADAADFGRELVERSRGERPSIDPDASPSEIMREALTEYLESHREAG